MTRITQRLAVLNLGLIIFAGTSFGTSSSSVTLASSANPATFGASVTLTATVTPSSATGTVTFKNGSATLGTGTLSGGKAAFSTSTLTVGSHGLKASYSGDANYTSSISAALAQKVNKANSAVALTSSANPSAPGSAVTFTAAITPSAATGTVTFKNGSTTLGTGTVSNGKATFSTATLTTGSHSMTAVYGGSTTYAGSTSATLTQVVTQTVTLTSIALTPAAVSMPLNSVQQYTAIGTYSDHSTQNLTTTASWSTSDASTATVSATGVLTALSQGAVTIQAAFGSVSGSTTLTVIQSSFVPVSNLHTPRYNHTATLLPNGKVLIAGGLNQANDTILSSAELYDPITGAFTLTGSLLTAREYHTATLLSSGKVVIVGGWTFPPAGGVLSVPNAELYDPATGLFTPAASFNTAFQDATVLNDGKILIAGGRYTTSNGGGNSVPAIYNPSLGTFATTGNFLTSITNDSATLLNDGTVLAAGGVDGSGSPSASAELYNEGLGTFSATGSLNTARSFHTASLLGNGAVLVAGGSCSTCSTFALASAELYDPVAKTFKFTGSLTTSRNAQTATVLKDGTVLIVGGGNSTITGTAELYNPVSQTFLGAGSLEIPRSGHTATLLNDGTVLIVGGAKSNLETQAELYAPTRPVPESLQITPASANLLVGGTQQFTAINNLGYPRLDATWTVSDLSLATITPDGFPTLTALAAGTVTLTATVDGISAQAQITISAAGSIAPGTAVWSLPPVPGFSPLQLAQAVPSSTGPDLYTTQLSSDGTQTIVQALTADGQQLWEDSGLPVLNANSVPDGFGGLIVTANQTCTSGQTVPMTITDLDPASGLPVWQITSAPYTIGNGQLVYCFPEAPQMAIRGDGTVFISAIGDTAGIPEFSSVNGQSGHVQNYSIPPSTNNVSGQVLDVFSLIGPPIVDSSGTAYVEYQVRNVNGQLGIVTSAAIYLLQVPIGSVPVSILLSSTTNNESLLPGNIIPDGTGGIVATWTVSPSNPPPPQFLPYQAADVVSGVAGTPYSLPFSPPTIVYGKYPSLVLGENGTAFATDSSNLSGGPKIVSFNVSTGSVNWSYQASQLSYLSLIEATSGNGLAAATSDLGGGVLIFNSSGAVQSAARRNAGLARVKPLTAAGLTGLSDIQYYSNGIWLGTNAGGAVAVLGSVIQSAMSEFPQVKGNGSKQNSHAPVIENFEPVDPAPPNEFATKFQARYLATLVNKVSLGNLTHANFEVGPLAIDTKFIQQILKPIDAVAFIGHSFSPMNRAIGLCFGQDVNGDGTFPCLQRVLVPTDPEYTQWHNDVGLIFQSTDGLFYRIDAGPAAFTSQAKIIFIAACDTDVNMQTWLGVTSSTTGRALVVPQSTTDIILNMGEYEWLQIMKYLESGKNLQQAVALANQDVANPTLNTWGVPAQAWQVIGDSGNGGTGIHF